MMLCNACVVGVKEVERLDVDGTPGVRRSGLMDGGVATVNGGGTGGLNRIHAESSP